MNSRPCLRWVKCPLFSRIRSSVRSAPRIGGSGMASITCETVASPRAYTASMICRSRLLSCPTSTIPASARLVRDNNLSFGHARVNNILSTPSNHEFVFDNRRLGAAPGVNVGTAQVVVHDRRGDQLLRHVHRHS